MQARTRDDYGSVNVVILSEAKNLTSYNQILRCAQNDSIDIV